MFLFRKSIKTVCFYIMIDYKDNCLVVINYLIIYEKDDRPKIN